MTDWQTILKYSPLPPKKEKKIVHTSEDSRSLLGNFLIQSKARYCDEQIFDSASKCCLSKANLCLKKPLMLSSKTISCPCFCWIERCWSLWSTCMCLWYAPLRGGGCALPILIELVETCPNLFRLVPFNHYFQNYVCCHIAEETGVTKKYQPTRRAAGGGRCLVLLRTGFTVRQPEHVTW